MFSKLTSNWSLLFLNMSTCRTRKGHPMMKHQTGKHDQVQASQRSRKPLIIAHQASEACRPGEGAFDHPSSWQQDKASFRLWKFDDLQSDPVFFGSLSRSITCVASIDEGNFDRLSGGLLNRLGKLTPLSTVLHIGRSHQQTQEVGKPYRRLHALYCPCVSWLHHNPHGCHGSQRRLQGSTIKDGRAITTDCALWLLAATSADHQLEQ